MGTTMSDQRNKLQSLFRAESRYENFGEALTSILVHGFRCHTDTSIEFESPIVAFCGLNGTGKSTLLQILASAYNTATDADERYYIKDFIVTGTLDPAPFQQDAYVEYTYWQPAKPDGSRSPRTLTLSRDAESKRWRGYRRQPQRTIYFAGIGLYLPRVEMRDFIVQQAPKLTVTTTTAIPERSKNWICKILACNYDVVHSNAVQFNNRSDTVVTVARYGATYSETNMGFGEGRIQHIINVLESLPDRSLVILEEPETSLHPSAQHELGVYLIDVCIQKRHQIFISTHSKYLLTALPEKSRVYLDRTPQGLRWYVGMSTTQAVSLMTGGHDKALHILVEDDVAEAILSELLRLADPPFLRAVKIYIGGDTDALQKTMKTIANTSLPVAAVRDGDKQGNPKESIFKLPGTRPPEQELLFSAPVQTFIRETYGVDTGDFLAAMHGRDHHEWFNHLAAQVATARPALLQQAAQIYARHVPANEVVALVQLLKGTIRL